MAFVSPHKNIGLAHKLLAACLLAVSFAAISRAQGTRRKTNLTQADRAAWHKVLQWPDDYEDRWKHTLGGDTPGEAGLQFHRLSRGKYLVEINVYPGAYQPGYIFMYYDEANHPSGPARLLKFKLFGENGAPPPYESEITGFPEFNKRTKVLQVFSKYRGPGDCGSLIKYRFVKGSPVVLEAREQDCDDRVRPTIEPDRWPRKKL